ncbi:FAD:protein FMN transferase [Lactococcus allomyrinae]|uniref:FAD:protein FMN transferase n=1 Tax=Lactococcus allomyrinae TaxID=2419773 RepID=A0A387BGK8_9LACT|nr:FAD:protein FMN transferase [Lactococcus allomyrinae]AYG00529.1 FAD:protein FMN transferase [Lactococcus allomyrinae]
MIPNFSEYNISKRHFALGTNIDLTIFGTTDKNILDESCQLIDDFEDKLTVNRAESEVMDINHAAGIRPTQVSVSTYDLVKIAVLKSQEHFGFNVAIGPLVKLWHIGFSDARVPTDSEIQARKALISADDIIFNDKALTVFLPQKGMELDLGGIGKGYIADRVQDYWRSRGIASGIINLGGNLITMGTAPQHTDGLWRVGVRNPLIADNTPIAVISVPACSAVTSGIAERHLEIDGKSYHHIIDPETGYPHDNQLASITVFSKYSIDGEIETTRLFFSNGTLPDWETQNDILYGALFAYRDKTLEIVGLSKNDVQIIDSSYQWKS